jgi:hypothetical protein
MFNRSSSAWLSLLTVCTALLCKPRVHKQARQRHCATQHRRRPHLALLLPCHARLVCVQLPEHTPCARPAWIAVRNLDGPDALPRRELPDSVRHRAGRLLSVCAQGPASLLCVSLLFGCCSRCDIFLYQRVSSNCKAKSACAHEIANASMGIPAPLCLAPRKRDWGEGPKIYSQNKTHEPCNAPDSLNRKNTQTHNHTGTIPVSDTIHNKFTRGRRAGSARPWRAR